MAIIVSSYTGVGFKNIETASVSIIQDDKTVLEILLGGVQSQTDNSIVSGLLFRKNGLWNVYNSQDLAPGKVFTECEDVIK
jgi:hypothetical protein